MSSGPVCVNVCVHPLLDERSSPSTQLDIRHPLEVELESSIDSNKEWKRFETAHCFRSLYTIVLFYFEKKVDSIGCVAFNLNDEPELD